MPSRFGFILNHYCNSSMQRLLGATVARLTPDQKVACSNHVGVIYLLFFMLLNFSNYTQWALVATDQLGTNLKSKLIRIILTSKLTNINNCRYKPQDKHGRHGGDGLEACIVEVGFDLASRARNGRMIRKGIVGRWIDVVRFSFFLSRFFFNIEYRQ